MTTSIINNPVIKYFTLEFIVLLLYNIIIINLSKIRTLHTNNFIIVDLGSYQTK